MYGICQMCAKASWSAWIIKNLKLVHVSSNEWRWSASIIVRCKLNWYVKEKISHNGNTVCMDNSRFLWEFHGIAITGARVAEGKE